MSQISKVKSRNNLFLLPWQVFRKAKIIDTAFDRYRKEMFRFKVTSLISQLLNILSAITSAYLVGIFIKWTSIREQWLIILLLLAFSTGHFLLTNLNSY